VSYGRTGNEIRLLALEPDGEGQALGLDLLGRRREIKLPLAGSFQATNALCALGLAIATGASPDDVLGALAGLRGVRGRIERVARHPTGAAVYVDYAHTPHALETVLAALRPHTTARLTVVFGAGGDRDRGKRPQMGAVAARLADRAIVTDDNPRSEDPAAIRAEILPACPGAIEIGDRGEAIRRAIADLAAGDVLVIAGKGHESGQTIGGVTHPFDDATVARAAVAALRRHA
jgi:UDP-N-acetylmuramoyl-L-alanyl-D-glutamate--2,6-diaminopimelate ligase